MKLNDYKMSVHPGTGLIGRFPSAVVLLAGDDDAAEPDTLIKLFSATPSSARGKDLGARLETLFAQLEPASISAFAAVVETDRGLSIYLHGPVEVAADSPNIEFRAWGPADTPLLRYDAPDAVGSLSVFFSDSANGNGNGSAALDLRAGVVSGNGLVLKRAGAPDPVRSNGSPPVVEPAAVPPVPPAPVTQVAEPLPQFQIPIQIPPPDPAPPATNTGDPKRLHPTYLTRLLTRLLVTLTIGAGLTAALGPVLRVGFAPVGVTYTTVFISLALLLGAGIVLWDPVYGLLQQSTKANGWPAPLQLAQAVPEALLVYGVQEIFLGDLVVNQTALITHLAVTSAAIAAATYGLTFVPVARRHLFRAGRGSDTGQPATRAWSTVDTRETAGPSGVNGSAGTPLVWGINCAEGHFNRPDARYCGTCGTAMHGLTREPVQGPRPALGYLVSDDGSAYVIDNDYVLGRSPQSDDKVRHGQARALTINGSAQAVSEAHADVHVDRWDVTISDRGHASGTYVREPDSTSLIRLLPGQPFALQSGAHVHLGQRNFVFHALNQR